MRKRNTKRKVLIPAIIMAAAVVILAVILAVMLKQKSGDKPGELLKTYMACIEEGDYDQMYDMLDGISSSRISREDFIERNRNIYEGIETSDI